MKTLRVCTLIIFLCVLVLPASAQVTLPRIIGDGMVLQRGEKVPIWGWADNQQPVVVEFDGQVATSIPNPNGSWRVDLQALEYGGPHRMVITQGDSRVILRDILIGEVWVCSGQSNMEMKVSNTDATAEEVAMMEHPSMRLFTVPLTSSQEPQHNCEGRWTTASPSTVSGFSATAYYFGLHLLEELQVPIGLIHSSWGGTIIEAWMSREALHEHPYFQYVFRFPYNDALRNEPAGLFNGMIFPLIPYAMRGVIWYQGEANAQRAHLYRELLPALIQDWRAAWGQGDFPFLFVQLTNFRTPQVTPVEKDSTWANLREAQLMALQSVPNTGMAVIIDIGEASDIHPKNKRDVGYRLALNALRNVYDRDIVYSGPIYQRMVVEGDQIRLYFDHTGSGLVAQGGPLTGFAVAGSDGYFFYADAEIDHDTVVVSSPRVKEPVIVRYGWADNPNCNLFNKEGLPASPFRTDDDLDAPVYSLVQDLNKLVVSIHSPLWKQVYDQEIPLDIRVIRGKKLALLTVLLDGTTIYSGTTLPTDIILNRGELADGSHVLQVLANDVNDSFDRLSIPFTVANTSILIPGFADQIPCLKGLVPIQIRTELPDSAIEQVTLKLIPLKSGDPVQREARVLFSSVNVPGKIEVNSKDFPDGPYDLSAIVDTTSGISSSFSRRIIIKNWIETVDEFEPPKSAGWFGTIDMSKTCEASKGWKYDGDAADVFFGDIDRKTRKEDTTEYLVWHSPGLDSFKLTLYSCIEDISNNTILSLSPDGVIWQDVPYAMYAEDSNDEGWAKLVLTGQVDNQDINFFRVTLTEGEAQPGDIHLGSLVLRSEAP